MTLHLSPEDGSGFKTGDRIPNHAMVTTDEDVITVFTHLRPEPLRIILTIGSGQDHMNAHFSGEDFRHRRRMGIIAKHHGFFAR